MMNSSTPTIKMRFLRPRSNSRLRLMVFGDPDAARLPRYCPSGSNLLGHLMAEIALRALFGLWCLIRKGCLWLMEWFS
ncbi:MAG: hypothetical protein EOP86_24975 [Verrucomicrobiaceae bacterium]|nr:MAG: hypothetical protein EOP86_24975 [Verrucomicrobiaceae bacterium]